MSEYCIFELKNGKKCSRKRVDGAEWCYQHSQNEKKVAEPKIRKKVVKTKDIIETVITMTFCEVGENHAGMEMVGKEIEIGEGFNLEDLQKASDEMKKLGIENVEIVNLNSLLEGTEYKEKAEPAYLLIARNALGKAEDVKALHAELMSVFWDSQYFDTRRKRVLNKIARSNMIAAEFDQIADYANRKGSIHSFERLPILSRVRAFLGDVLGEKGRDMIAEGNRYEDGGSKKNGIGYHGDSERRRVVAIRTGKQISMPFHYQWFIRHAPIGTHFEININAGDLYIMSEKAVGTDWKKSTIPTLRHATGAKKYTEIKL